MKSDPAMLEAARALGKRSVEARKEAWGEDLFRRRMQAYGKLGGRPTGSKKNSEGKS